MRKSMYRNLLLAGGLVALAFLGSCDSGSKTTESGLEYSFVTKGEGVKGDSGLVLLMNIEYLDEKDSVMFSSKETNIPVAFNYPVDEKGKFMEALRLLSEGDSAVFKMTAFDFFVMSFRRPVPVGVDSSSTMTFNIGVDNIYTREEYNVYQAELNKKLQAEAEERARVQMETDKGLIEEHLVKNGIEAQQTESGLYYVITEEGTGENAKAGQKISVNYTGYVLEGAHFDTSIEEVARANGILRPGEYKPFEFQVGLGQVIRGWDEGLTLLNKGAKATLYIPSPLGYGERKRSEVIVENSILVFEVELLDILTDNQ